MITLNRTRRLAAVAATLTVTVPMAACSADTSAAGDVTIEAAQYSWPAAELTNAIIEQIIEQNPDLGVNGMSTTQLDPATAWAGAKRGDIAMITEVAMPNQLPMAMDAADTMEIVSETYSNASQGWFVPSYVVEPGGAAEGLTSVSQLNEYRDVFGGKLYDADPGYVTTKQNRKRLSGYGINYEQIAAGEAAQLAQLTRSYQRKEPILVYLYHPHWVFASFDMVQLKEPKPFREDCFTKGDGACAMPAYSGGIALSKDLQSEAPKFAKLIENFRISIAEMEGMQKAMDIDKKDAKDVAQQWIEEHGDAIQGWLKSA